MGTNSAKIPKNISDSTVNQFSTTRVNTFFQFCSSRLRKIQNDFIMMVVRIQLMFLALHASHQSVVNLPNNVTRVSVSVATVIDSTTTVLQVFVGFFLDLTFSCCSVSDMVRMYTLLIVNSPNKNRRELCLAPCQHPQSAIPKSEITLFSLF